MHVVRHVPHTMRVVGGTLGGRKLRGPPDAVRPTSDRVREALFASLGDFAGARVLDAYAGTGALGVEAISRGAAHATFIERSKRCLAVVRGNLSDLAIEPQCRVISGDARPALARLAQGRAPSFDCIFVDPPYASDEAAGALRAIAKGGLLATHGVLVIECATRHPVPAEAIEDSGMNLVDERRYGDTTILRLESAAAAGAEAVSGNEDVEEDLLNYDE